MSLLRDATFALPDKREYIDFQAATISKSSVTFWPDCGHLRFVKHWKEYSEP